MTEWMDAVSQFVVGAGFIILALGLVKLIFVPLALAFELSPKRRRNLTEGCTQGDDSLVSVVVPAYNESKVIENCMRSVLLSNHSNLELIVVDDGSTDDTVLKAHACAFEDDRVRVISLRNGGKGRALNHGIEVSSGEVVLLVDADGVFEPELVDHMLAAFDGPQVGAVCGDDRPVNLDRVQTRFLSLISHVGTGLVRRALSLMGCLPIVSGNVGGFRRSVLHEVGKLNEDTVGEDLELTWRVQRAGYKVRFEPRAIVYAESPSTLRALWKQRTRWNRGLLQVTDMHRDMIGNPRYGAFGMYLLFNTLNMIVVPLLQLLVLPLLVFLLVRGQNPVGVDVWGVLLWLGLGLSMIFVLIAVALNRAWADFRFGLTLLLWPAFSVFTGLTLVAAMFGEAGGKRAKWNKLERTGVVSRQILPPEELPVASCEKELQGSFL